MHKIVEVLYSIFLLLACSFVGVMMVYMIISLLTKGELL